MSWWFNRLIEYKYNVSMNCGGTCSIVPNNHRWWLIQFDCWERSNLSPFFAHQHIFIQSNYVRLFNLSFTELIWEKQWDSVIQQGDYTKKTLLNVIWQDPKPRTFEKPSILVLAKQKSYSLLRIVHLGFMCLSCSWHHN